MFVPQGWRLDLVGIDPAEQWDVMRGWPQRADAGPWESIWVYDHFHTVPDADRRGDARGVDADGRVRRGRPSRVRLGQMCTCMAYRNPAYLAKVAATVDVISGGRVEMGIGARLVRARVAGLRLRLPAAPASGSAMLDEGVQIMRQAWTDRRRRRCDGKHYQVDGAHRAGRCRCRTAASRCGSPAAARR